MGYESIAPGKDLPNDLNVIIEIAANSDPVKYEVDKDSGALFVDRFMGTSMVYPCNYGYIPQTLAADGDPVDVLVMTPFPLQPGCVVRVRPIGILKMTDESGGDAKLLGVPVEKLLPSYRCYQSQDDVSPEFLNRIQHFFEHYKDLEKGKWVKIEGWGTRDEMVKEIMDGVANYQK
ncbi:MULTISPECIES: inorganic diphosphatase [Limnobacter]|uniref:Inorganic pyrophosphatase n=1 Tax=Limnobacter litoralis TaxID=481366 RepID=A0ABQ5YP78_9BURK|nr:MULTISPECIES: inorganic diphosphatase [Limnobacter]GLR26379.1 inorganic pyrophosphatase [Limnobacter litoralis]HEX5485595.1 inorganic diphosphatase [Limnobacter sp.]